MGENYNINNGYIALWRSLLSWGWYKDQNTKCVFIHLLLSATYTERVVRGIPLKRGDYAVSIRGLAVETGMTVTSVRVAIKHLIATQEITQGVYPRFSVFTILKYDEYQNNDKHNNTGTTQQQHGNDTGTTQPYSKQEGNKEIRKYSNKGFETKTAKKTQSYDIEAYKRRSMERLMRVEGKG